MPKILAFSGSIRRESWNRKLIRVAVDATRAAGGDVTLIDLADYPLPLYNGDLEERDGLPDNAQRLKALFKEHDALLIASPEYNSSMPPLLKNTLDWVSREWQGESQHPKSPSGRLIGGGPHQGCDVRANLTGPECAGMARGAKVPKARGRPMGRRPSALLRAVYAAI